MLANKRIRLRLEDLHRDLFKDDPFYRFALMLLSAVYSLVHLGHVKESKYRYAYRRNRYINPRYYARYKYLEFPQGYKWVLLTLTLRRDIPLCSAWANIGSWVSSFLHNLRTHFYRKGVRVPYFWVIEPHKDGYPHVHILVAFPFLHVEKLQSWWRWSDPQGVDVRFIGSDTDQVRSYVLKYLLKHQYVDFEVNYKEGYIEFGLIPFLLWYNRVRILGRSKGFVLRRLERRSEWFYVGSADLELDVLHDLRDRLSAMRIDYDTQELKSLVVSFLQTSSLIFTYRSKANLEPISTEVDPCSLDF